MTFDEFCSAWMRERTETLIGRIIVTDELVAEISREFQAALRRVYPWGFDVSVDVNALEHGNLNFNISRPENVIRDHPDVLTAEAQRELAQTIIAPRREGRGFEAVRETVLYILGTPQGARLPRIEHGPAVEAIIEFMVAMPRPNIDGRTISVTPLDGVQVRFTPISEDWVRVSRRGVEITVPATDRGIMVRGNTLWPETHAMNPDPALSALGF